MTPEAMNLTPLRTLFGLSVPFLLIACVGRGGTGPTAPVPESLESQIETVLPHTDPDVLYYVGAAELAGMREEFLLAAELYSRAAEISSDPDIAAQAVRVAAHATSEELTLKGVARWLELAPDHPEPHRVAALIYLRRGEGEQAWQHIKAVLDPRPPVERWDAVAKMLAGTRDRAAALEVYRQISEHYEIPHSTELRQQLSDLGAQLGDLELAERFATMTLEVDPQNAESHNWRGRLRTSLNRLEEARADFERAIELDPENEQMRQTYAALLAEVDDYEGAIAQLEEVADSLVVIFSKGIYANEAGDEELALGYYLDLQNLEVEDESEKHFFLGQLAETLDRPVDETVEWYDRVRSGERMDSARLRSAVVLGQNGELPKARAILRRLQNGNARTAANAYLAEAGLLRDLDHLEDAIGVYDEALSLLPENTDLLFARALLAERLGRLEVTEKDLRRVLDLSPDNPNALNALGYTLADRTQRYDEALAMIEKALAQMPDEPAFVDSMGWVQFKLGNYDQALAFLERALDLQYDSEIAAHLGEVLWVLGRQSEARQLWAEALEKEPDSSVLQETVSRLAGD